MKLINLKLLSTILSVLIFTSSCETSNELGVKLSGNLKEKGEGIVTLSQYMDAGFEPIDTIYIDDDFSFKFFVEVSGPEFFRLNFYGRQQVSFILDGSEREVNILAHGTDPNAPTKITGSIQTGYLQAVDSMVAAQKSSVNELNQKAIKARMDGDNEVLTAITDEYYESVIESQIAMKDFIRSVVPSLAGFYAMGSIDPEQDFKFYEEIAKSYQSKVPDHPFTKDIVSLVNNLRKLAIGAEAPEISLPSPSGELVTLSSLKGNYVLVDFWAAWCRPCRAENPNVVRMYNQYSNNNFEILGVSLDRNRASWLKAIEDDGLMWKHVSDLKYFNSEAASDYKIASIPATYLIGPDGTIIAKNLRGPSLEAKLKEIFG